MKGRNNLLSCPKDRASRHEEKKRVILRFLRQHIWSTQDILQNVMQLASRQAAHKMLTQLERESLLRRHTYDLLVGKLTIWGITNHGQAMAFDLAVEEPVNSYFEPSRISEQNIYHQLDLQRLRVQAERNGWHNWIDGNRLGQIGKALRRPDGIALDPLGRLSAIECERTIKTVKRYEVIIAEYLQAIKNGTISRVIWVSPTKEISARLRSIILRIETVVVAGQRVTIDPTRHHYNLFFTDYSKWPEI